MSAITLDEFRRDFRNGGYRSVGLSASGELFYVTARPRSGGPVTLGTPGFRDPGSAIALLHQIGARQIEVDTSGWKSPALEPDAPSANADHDLWFRAEVEQALRDADDPRVARIPQEEVASNWTAQRAELLKRTRASS